jgi:hypothetical protein
MIDEGHHEAQGGPCVVANDVLVAAARREDVGGREGPAEDGREVRPGGEEAGAVDGRLLGAIGQRLAPGRERGKLGEHGAHVGALGEGAGRGEQPRGKAGDADPHEGRRRGEQEAQVRPAGEGLQGLLQRGLGIGAGKLRDEGVGAARPRRRDRGGL